MQQDSVGKDPVIRTPEVVGHDIQQPCIESVGAHEVYESGCTVGSFDVNSHSIQMLGIPTWPTTKFQDTAASYLSNELLHEHL